MLGTLHGLLLSAYDKVRGARFTVFTEHLTSARCWGCKGGVEGKALTS